MTCVSLTYFIFYETVSVSSLDNAKLTLQVRAEMLDKVADYYQTEHRTIIDSLKAFIEPALIVILAVVVGGIVMAVILPMFGLYSQIK